MSRPRSIVGRSHEVFNARDFDAYPEVLDEHVELVIAGVTFRGLAAVTDYLSGWLELIVTDDRTGGADASAGSGLTGLVDRVEAIGGTIRIDSPSDAGTAIHVKLPTRLPET